MPEPPSTKPPSASYLSRIRRSLSRSSPGVVKVHAPKQAPGGRPAGEQTAERLHPPSSLLERAAAKVQVAWRARADSKAQAAAGRAEGVERRVTKRPLKAAHPREAAAHRARYATASAAEHKAAATIQARARGRASRLYARVTNPLDALSEAREDLNQRFARASNHMTFQLVRRLIESSLRGEVKDNPWLPRGANDQMIARVEAFLKELNLRLDKDKDEISDPTFQKEMRELVKIKNWPPPPPRWPNPAWWARCRVLYALSPADRNSTYRSVVKAGRWMALLYLLLWMPFGISSIAWLVYLLCVLTVDDEYQLFTFILRFKAFAFLMWGVIPIIVDQFAFYITTITGKPITGSSPTGADDGRPDPGSICISGGPSTSLIDRFSDVCFLLTWFISYLVFARYKWVRREHLSGRKPRSVWTGDKDNGDIEINAVMACDLLFTSLFTLVLTLYRAFHTNTDKVEMYIVALYTTMLGLCCLPWIVFFIPGVGLIIHQMRPTGFDEAGGLKLQMDLQQMKRKQTRLMHANLLSDEEAELLDPSLSEQLVRKASGKASAMGAAVRRPRRVSEPNTKSPAKSAGKSPKLPFFSSYTRYAKLPAAVSPA